MPAVSLLALAENGWLEYSWRRGYENFLPDRAWLNLNQVERAYAFCGRVPRQEHAAALQAVLLRYQGRFLLSWKNRFAEDQLRFLQEHLKPSRLLPAHPQEAENLLKILRYCDTHSAMERVLSVNCFQDSKYLEHTLEQKLIPVIRQYEPTAAMYRESERKLTDHQLLSLMGIQKAAEILEFCGDLRFLLNGQWIRTGAFRRLCNVSSFEKRFGSGPAAFSDGRGNIFKTSEHGIGAQRFLSAKIRTKPRAETHTETRARQATSGEPRAVKNCNAGRNAAAEFSKALRTLTFLSPESTPHIAHSAGPGSGRPQYRAHFRIHIPKWEAIRLQCAALIPESTD